jgi:hypothetical protein
MNRRVCAILMVFMMCALGIARGQDSSAFADTKLYDSVLDRLFQHAVRPGTSEIQLRYSYCDQGEMQVVVHRLQNSDFSLDVWFVPPGSPNIWRQLAGLAQANPTLNPETAVGLLKLSHKTVVEHSTTAFAAVLDKATSLSIPLLSGSTVTLDGMAYGIAVRSISEDASLTFQGPQQADKSDNQVIRWMGQVRSNLDPRLKN